MPGDKLIKIFTLCLLFCLIPFSSLFSEQEMNDEEFIKMVMERTFRFFWDEANPDNGLIPDATSNPDCSNSVTGFGLAAVCIAHKMGWITYKEAYDRVLKTLQNFADYPGNPSSIQVQKEHGHHYHWVDINSGQWIEQEGIWATDTAAFIAGVITVGEYFKGTEVQKTANMIYTNVDWTWFLNKNNNFFYVGWQPEEGFIYEYRMTKMGILPLIMAISSPTHPVPVETWYNLGNTYYHANYKGYNYVGDGAAYMHQWPLCFIDPRLKKDYFLDYFQDTREFSLASRQWCIDNKQDGYHENNWGLNPSVGPGDIYGEYAAPVIPGAPVPYNGKNNDGTVAPTAAISFMPFTPKESLAYMKYIYEKYKDEIFGKYGFTDSYNVKKDWWCKNFLGIDQGPIIIMLDNYLNGTVWKSFMANKYIRKGMQKIGFTGIIDDFDRTDHSPSYAKWLSLKDKYKFNKINTKSKEGEYSLKIKLTKIEKKDFFVIEPELKDLSGYKYLAFWQSGGFRPGILLVDSNKKRSSIKYIKKVMDGSWALYYYDISKLGIDTGSIHKIVVYLRSRYREDVYLDHIHLAHNMIDKLPPAPMNFKAETGKLRGEIKLSWNTPKPETQSGHLASYKVKMSESPIKTKKEFELADNSIKHFIKLIEPGKGEFIAGGLKPGKQYYFAMAIENSIYALSDIQTSGAKANSEKIEDFTLSKKELVDFNIADYKPVSAEGDIVHLSKVKGETGDALRLQYNMMSEKSWHWVGVNRSVKGKLPEKFKFTLLIKSEGVETDLEFKIMDRNGAVFGKKIDDLSFDSTWEKIEIASSELTYWWGGNGSKEMALVDSIELAFSGPETGEGYVILNKLTFEKK